MRNIQQFLDGKLLNAGFLDVSAWDLFSIVLIIIGSWLVFYLVRRVIRFQQNKELLAPGKAFALLQLVRYFLVVIAITLIFQAMGIDMTIIIASSAALLVGVGLGVQRIFNDMISGLILLFGRPVSIGDVIEVDGEVGRVSDIGFRASRIITRDNINMIIPNHKFVSEKVVNWSLKNHLTRFHLLVGVAHGSDTEQVKALLLEAAHEHNHVSSEKKPMVRFVEWGSSRLTFDLLFYSHNIFRIENTLSDLRFSIHKKFRENHVVVSFPQQDIHIKSMPGTP